MYEPEYAPPKRSMLLVQIRLDFWPRLADCRYHFFFWRPDTSCHPDRSEGPPAIFKDSIAAASFLTKTWVKTRKVHRRRRDLSEVLRFAEDDRFWGTHTELLHCHRLRQVPGLVNVAASADSNVICQQLQRHDFEDRQQQFRRLGNIQHVIR